MNGVQAIVAVSQGQLVECTSAEWLAVRSTLSAFASQMVGTRREAHSIIAFREIARLDEHFDYVPGKPFQPGKVNAAKAQPSKGFVRPGQHVKFAIGAEELAFISEFGKGPFTVAATRFTGNSGSEVQRVTFEETPGYEFDSDSLKVFRYGEVTNG